MHITTHTADVTTDSSGDFTVDLTGVNGIVMQIRYVVDVTAPLATGSDLTISGQKTGIEVLTFSNIGVSSFTRAPRQLTATNTSGANGTVLDYIAVNEDLVFTIAQGGDTKVGTFYVEIGQ